MRGADRLRSALSPPGPHLIAYLMAGDPDLEATKAYARALAGAGVSVLEVGVPFSDPIADGPVIQAAATRALAGGTRPAQVFSLVRQLRDEGLDLPIALMTYYNILHKPGVPRWVADAVAAGVDGVIVPDLPVEEAGPLRDAARPAGFGTVFLASPATDDARLDRIAGATTGFLYLVSTYGVTGAREKLPDSTLQLVQRVTKHVAGRVPLAVGFGVGQPAQVRALHAAGADAVVVGSAIVQRVAGGASPQDVGAFIRDLRSTGSP